MTKWKKVTLCFMGIVILAAWAVSTIFFFFPFFSALEKAFNPGLAFARAFKTDFKLINRSGEPVKVWCLGISDPGGDLVFLPFVKIEKFAWLEWLEYLDLTTIALSPNERRDVSYDCDDVKFQWIVVRSSKGGAYKLIRVDPSKNSFMIPPLKTLPNAPQKLVDFIEAASREKKLER
jgi:hypothetical protein